jgi:hypothetical protein
MTEPPIDRALEDALRALETPTLPAADRAAIRAAIRTAGAQQDGNLGPPPPATGPSRSWQIVVGLAGLALTVAVWQVGRAPHPVVDAPAALMVDATPVARTPAVAHAISRGELPLAAPTAAISIAPTVAPSDSATAPLSGSFWDATSASTTGTQLTPSSTRVAADSLPPTAHPTIADSWTSPEPTSAHPEPLAVDPSSADPPRAAQRVAPARPTATPGPVLPHTPTGEPPPPTPTGAADTAPSPGPSSSPITGIAGTVRLDGAPFAFAAVRAVPAEGSDGGFVVGSTDGDGAYLLRLTPGAWRVAAEGDGWPARWWPGAARVEEAAVVVVIAGAVTGGIDFDLR